MDGLRRSGDLAAAPLRECFVYLGFTDGTTIAFIWAWGSAQGRYSKSAPLRLQCCCDLDGDQTQNLLSQRGQCRTWITLVSL